MQVLWAFQSQAQRASDLADRPRLSEADLARELDGLLQAMVDMTRTIIQVSRELEDYLPPADNPLQLKRLYSVYLEAREPGRGAADEGFAPEPSQA